LALTICTQTNTSGCTTSALGKQLPMISHTSSPDALLGTEKAKPTGPNFLLHTFTFVYIIQTDGRTDGQTQIDR
jgi:hypothetical protein